MKNIFSTSIICLIFFIGLSQPNLQAQDNQKQNEAQNSLYIGTFEGDRNITLNAAGELMYQRLGAPIALKMIKIEDNLYELEIPANVRSPREIPKVQFIENENTKIIEIHLVFKDGRKDGPFKKIN